MFFGANSMSRGEERIATILTRNHIRFQREVMLPYVKRKKPLRYDFGIFNNQNQLIALIEFNGKQHYQQVKNFQKTHQDFEKQKEYDRIKISASLARGIPLYIIPYTEEEQLFGPADIFQERFIAKNKWHNDLWPL